MYLCTYEYISQEITSSALYVCDSYYVYLQEFKKCKREIYSVFDNVLNIPNISIPYLDSFYKCVSMYKLNRECSKTTLKCRFV